MHFKSTVDEFANSLPPGTTSLDSKTKPVLDQFTSELPPDDRVGPLTYIGFYLLWFCIVCVMILAFGSASVIALEGVEWSIWAFCAIALVDYLRCCGSFRDGAFALLAAGPALVIPLAMTYLAR
jgi:hypothetical protein